MDRRARVINIWAAASVALCFLLIFGTGSAEAGIFDADTDEYGPYSMCEQIVEGPFAAIYDILGVESDHKTEYFKDAYDMIIEGEYSPVLKTAYYSLKAIAALWVIAVAVGRLFVKVQRGRDPMEAAFSALVEICVAGIFIINLDKLTDTACALGTKITEMFKPGEDKLEADFVKDLVIGLTGSESPGLLESIKCMLILALPWVISFMGKMAGIMIVVSVMIETGVRRAFVPLAIGDIYAEGLRGPGVRYLKKLLACVLKLAVCGAVCILCGELLVTAAGGLSEGRNALELMGLTGVFIAITWTAVSTMSKGGEIVNDALGV